ncbi:MAG: lactate racemase domain-containing protein [Candidatus Bathyarchaeia archaeon]
MVDIWLPYGRTEVHATIASDNLMGIIELHDEPGIKDVTSEIEKAAKELISSEKIMRMERKKDKIALSLNIFDIPLAKLILSSVMKEIAYAGLRDENLVVIITNNPFMMGVFDTIKHLKEEIASLLGINVVVHDPTHDNIHVCDLEDGAKVYLDKAFVEADVRVAISTVEPSPYTLYSCCEIGVAFGLTSLETIKDILLPILDADDFQERVFEKSIKVSEIAKLDLSMGIVKNPRNEVARYFVGDPEKVLRKSLDAVNSIYRVILREQPDIVIISPGGSPFDADIFSAYMYLENALKVVRRNGVVILVAECSEGYRRPEHYQLIRKVNGDLSLLEETLKSEFTIEGFIAYRFLRTFKKASIIMASSIPDYYASKIPGLKIFRSVNDALNDALNRFRTKVKVTVAPYGIFIPIIEK